MKQRGKEVKYFTQSLMTEHFQQVMIVVVVVSLQASCVSVYSLRWDSYEQLDYPYLGYIFFSNFIHILMVLCLTTEKLGSSEVSPSLSHYLQGKGAPW